MTPYLELDQCSNSRTHQDLAPTKTHMEVHILSNGIKQPRLRTKLKSTAAVLNKRMETKLEHKFKRCKWKETLSKAKLPNGNWRNERRTLIERSLLDFEIWRSNSCHLEPYSKISEGVPPLEAHRCKQDKARKKKTQDSQFLSKFEYSLSTLNSKSDLYKGNTFIYSL